MSYRNRENFWSETFPFALFMTALFLASIGFGQLIHHHLSQKDKVECVLNAQ